ncbi:hypothetical protein J6590_004948 [Homalodisca vitripennis]|nr:hypothetical protein J6590_004948 [Homalodisca vitripennis]
MARDVATVQKSSGQRHWSSAETRSRRINLKDISPQSALEKTIEDIRLTEKDVRRGWDVGVRLIPLRSTARGPVSAGEDYRDLRGSRVPPEASKTHDTTGRKLIHTPFPTGTPKTICLLNIYARGSRHSTRGTRNCETAGSGCNDPPWLSTLRTAELGVRCSAVHWRQFLLFLYQT